MPSIDFRRRQGVSDVLLLPCLDNVPLPPGHLWSLQLTTQPRSTYIISCPPCLLRRSPFFLRHSPLPVTSPLRTAPTLTPGAKVPDVAAHRVEMVRTSTAVMTCCSEKGPRSSLRWRHHGHPTRRPTPFPHAELAVREFRMKRRVGGGCAAWSSERTPYGRKLGGFLAPANATTTRRMVRPSIVHEGLAPSHAWRVSGMFGKHGHYLPTPCLRRFDGKRPGVKGRWRAVCDYLPV